MNDPQHQRSLSSNVIMYNNVESPPSMVVGGVSAVDEHFKKSLDNVTVSGYAPMQSWKDKNLPDSFKIKPSAACSSVGHSRDGSTDSSGCYSTQSPQQSLLNPSIAGIQHSRAHSSPENLTGVHLSFAQPKGGQRRGGGAANVQHNRIKSFDIDFMDVPNNQQQQPILPPGWEKRQNPPPDGYFINQIEKGRSVDQLIDGVKMGGASSSLAEASLGQLPLGWEEASTPEGHKYYINHNTKTTTWYDPRIPEELQQPTIMQMQMQQQQQMNPSMQVNQNRTFPPQTTSNHSHQLSSGGIVAVGGQGLARTGSVSSDVVAAASFSPNSQTRVQELTRERQSYRMRQDEIMKQGLLNTTPVLPVSPQHTFGVDGFGSPQFQQRSHVQQQPSTMLAQTGEYHFRQESTDSGLGMPPFAAGGYSHPHTPENFLSSEFPPLNIAGIDLNIGSVPTAMEMDNIDEIPQISQRDLDQVFNYQRTIRH